MPKLRHAALGIFAVLVLVLAAGSVYAISQATKYSVPLTAPYPRCGSDNDTISECTTSTALTLTSPWTFSQGTVVIETNKVSLRFDGMHLRDSEACPGATGDCSCWGGAGSGYWCDDNSDCGGDTCGPTSANGADWATVKIYLQNYYEPFPMLWNNYHIRRHNNCVVEVSVDLDNPSNDSNKNRRINQSVTQTFGCGYGTTNIPAAEIRRVEVYDSSGMLMAVPTW